MSFRSPVLLLVLVLAGCESPEWSGRVVELEVKIVMLEQRLEALEDLPPRIKGLEALSKTAPAPAPPEASLASDVLRLQKRIEALESRLKEDGDGFTTIKGVPASVRPPPTAGEPVEVIHVSGAQLLIRTKAGTLERVSLLGVDPPRRGEVYAGQPKLRDRHQRLFGRRLKSDAAWEACRDHLEGLLRGSTEVKLAYEAAGPRRVEGTVPAYVERREGDATRDINAALIKAGYALAGGEHDRQEVYTGLQAEAQTAKRGLFAPASPAPHPPK